MGQATAFGGWERESSSLLVRATTVLIFLVAWPALASTLVAQTAPSSAPRPTRRAVLVGINKYSPCKPGEAAVPNEAKIPGVAPGRSHCNDWINLDGSLNDVQAMRQVLQARFGFEKENMHILSTPLIPGVSEKEATRQNILDAIKKYLVEEAKPGDIVVFYYAGHGSQMGNSKSREAASAGGTGRDETIVPADANRGVWDIRDKEFARLFNKIVDRQAKLTAIFDSCHSGSIARGAVVPHKSRHIADDDRDSKDDYDEAPPENRGALIFSAALSSQEAMEVEEREADQKPIPHGAFTLALLKVLRTAPVNLPAKDIALMVKTQLDAENIRQLPNLNGTDERKRQPLIATGSGAFSGSTRVAVAGMDDETVSLDGGWALGLNAGCELRKVTDDKNAPPIRVQITQMDSLTQSEAKILQGSAKAIHAGDLFEIDKWVPQAGARLRVWIASPALSREAVLQAAQEASQFARASNVQWVEDPTGSQVSNLTQVYWNGTQWTLAGPAAATQDLGASLGGRLSLALLGGSNGGAKGKPQLFLALPPTTELARALDFEATRTNRAIEVTSSREEADYLLMGRVRNGKLEYAWVLPEHDSGSCRRFPAPGTERLVHRRRHQGIAWQRGRKTARGAPTHQPRQGLAQLARASGFRELSLQTRVEALGLCRGLQKLYRERPGRRRRKVRLGFDCRSKETNALPLPALGICVCDRQLGAKSTALPYAKCRKRSKAEPSSFESGRPMAAGDRH